MFYKVSNATDTLTAMMGGGAALGGLGGAAFNYFTSNDIDPYSLALSTLSGAGLGAMTGAAATSFVPEDKAISPIEGMLFATPVGAAIGYGVHSFAPDIIHRMKIIRNPEVRGLHNALRELYNVQNPELRRAYTNELFDRIFKNTLGVDVEALRNNKKLPKVYERYKYYLDSALQDLMKNPNRFNEAKNEAIDAVNRLISSRAITDDEVKRITDLLSSVKNRLSRLSHISGPSRAATLAAALGTGALTTLLGGYALHNWSY